MNFMDFMEFHKTFGNSIPQERVKNIAKFKENLQEFFTPNYNFNVLPMDYPQKGWVGLTIFKQLNDSTEMSLGLYLPVVEKAVPKKYTSRKEFEEAFSAAWESLCPIQPCDDPVERYTGFIVETREGRTWHYIGLVDYKKNV